MGIIRNQSIKGTIYAYVGVIIGFITTGLIYPRVLSTDEVGLLRLLVSVSVLFAQFAGLGFNSVTLKNFAFFRDPENNHHGFFRLGLVVNGLGVAFVLIVFFIIKPWLVEANQDKSALFVEYILYLVPLIVFTSFFNFLDTYYRVLYNALKGLVTKEVFQRLFILASVLLYYFGAFEIDGLVLMYVFALCLPAVIISISLYRKGNFLLGWDKGFINRRMAKHMTNVSLFGIATSLSGVLILNIDVVMINHFLGLADTGIYAVTFYFGTLVLIPSRPAIKIASVVIADGWKEMDLKKIEDIYKRSNVTLTIIGLLFFLGLMINIDNIFLIIGSDYETGKFVILFIGLANLIEMCTSVSQSIISTSKHYRVVTWFLLLFMVMMIVTNLIFIPMYGIVGAAIASVISRFVYNFLSWFFLFKKFSLQPFNVKYYWIILIGIVSYVVAYIIPQQSWFIWDIILRSATLTIIYIVLIYFIRASADFNLFVESILSYAGVKK